MDIKDSTKSNVNGYPLSSRYAIFQIFQLQYEIYINYFCLDNFLNDRTMHHRSVVSIVCDSPCLVDWSLLIPN